MISYNNIDITFLFKNKLRIKKWVLDTIKEEGKNISYISYNFCSDKFILELNISSLDHHYYTDIITFELNEKNQSIEGDIYISIDRVKDNANQLNELFVNELHRVIIHGTLHLCGYKDKSKRDAKIMREKENYYLNKR
ncbi:MAG: rRNA maturation RNase YbeY [Bacteroidia bacterium]